jgi:protein-S-isoprenylcysteine O-methyltransferase Ste14
MVSWINFAVLVVSTCLLTIYYLKSVGPAALELDIGPISYEKCATYRLISAFCVVVASINYILYFWFPLPVPLPKVFPWSWWISVVIAILITIPSAYFMVRGVLDAGEETLTPKREHQMYGGIYLKMRHPQAIGEFFVWWILALFLNSPFLTLYSFVFVPIWITFCIAEERDLLLRYGTTYEEYRKRTGFLFPR